MGLKCLSKHHAPGEARNRDLAFKSPKLSQLSYRPPFFPVYARTCLCFTTQPTCFEFSRSKTLDQKRTLFVSKLADTQLLLEEMGEFSRYKSPAGVCRTWESNKRPFACPLVIFLNEFATTPGPLS